MWAIDDYHIFIGCINSSTCHARKLFLFFLASCSTCTWRFVALTYNVPRLNWTLFECITNDFCVIPFAYGFSQCISHHFRFDYIWDYFTIRLATQKLSVSPLQHSRMELLQGILYNLLLESISNLLIEGTDSTDSLETSYFLAATRHHCKPFELPLRFVQIHNLFWYHLLVVQIHNL